jgi:DNA polymerase III sliding clamp (beta) subunit (PCNA family)
MLAELKFVQGAVAKKDFIPAITHFAISNGTVRAYNGVIALSTPIACNLNCTPKAVPMVQAISKCVDTISLSITATGRLAIKSGNFKAYIDCIENTDSHLEPEGERVEINGTELLKGFKAVQAFIGNDASRAWTNGVLLKGQSLFATNNVCLVEYWLGDSFPIVVNIPRSAIAEIIRINEAPKYCQIAKDSISFHYGEGKWIRSQLYESEWPDLAPILNCASNPIAIPNELFIGLDNIKPFCNDYAQVFLSSKGVSTSLEDNEGATFEIDWPHRDSIYSVNMLKLLDGIATTADFERDGAAMFFGERLRGAIIGMRLMPATSKTETTE